MKIKKILSAALAAVMSLGILASCGDSDSSGTSSEASSDASSGSSSVSDGEPKKGDFSKSSADFVKGLGVGWNNGNSLDAVGGEEAWGNVETSKALIDLVKDSGFTTIRIPITWIGHFDDDYNIDSDWLGRVHEVVDYCIDDGLYTIINIHHDGSSGIDGKWLDAVNADQDEVNKNFGKMWEQISAEFKNYDEHLIFESMNEIMEDGNYGKPAQTTFDNINRLNQTFVDTVRKSGGNNDQRYLLIPGYNTNIDQTLAGFVLPTDSADKKLIVSVHDYDPWNWAGQGTSESWGEGFEGKNDGWGQEDYFDSQYDKLKSAYVDNGIGVIIGECGCVHQDNKDVNRCYYMAYTITAALDRGLCPVIWDNGGEGSGADKFGIFNRYTKEVIYPDYLESIITHDISKYSASSAAA